MTSNASIDPADLPILRQVARSDSSPWYLFRQARIGPANAHDVPNTTVASRMQCDETTRLENLSPLRARRPGRAGDPASATRVPRADFAPPSSEPRSSGLPAKGRWITFFAVQWSRPALSAELCLRIRKTGRFGSLPPDARLSGGRWESSIYRGLFLPKLWGLYRSSPVGSSRPDRVDSLGRLLVRKGICAKAIRDDEAGFWKRR